MQWEPGSRYLISYANESLETSVRTIDVIRTSRSGDGLLYIRAFCHLRGMERTFRDDRIIHAERVQSVCSASGQSARYYSAVPHSPVTADRGSPGMKAVADSGSSPFRWAICIVVLLLLSVASLANLQGSRPSYSSTTTSTLNSSAPVKPVPRPSPPPKPALEETTIAGYTLRTVRGGGLERFEVPELGLVTMSKLEAVAAIRLPVFVEEMGFFNADLVGRYLDADLNGSGRLAFEELKVFQEKTCREFRYESNELALRPDEFLAAGGGDCEDFALYTAGLLRFWGWEPYLGSLAASRGSIGHAVCLSYEEGAIPKDFEYFELSAWTTEDSSALRAGTYVPIDYDHVGSLSDAVGAGWKLRSVYIPEKAWGLSM